MSKKKAQTKKIVRKKVAKKTTNLTVEKKPGEDYLFEITIFMPDGKKKKYKNAVNLVVNYSLISFEHENTLITTTLPHFAKKIN